MKSLIKLDNQKKDFIKNICIIFIIIMLLEIFAFNFKSFKTLFSKNEYEFEQSSFSVYEVTEDYIYIEIDNIFDTVKTLYVSIDNVDTVEYQFLYTDDTSSGFREMYSKIYVQNIEDSKYISTYLSGESSKIALKVFSLDADVTCISINKDIPFDFNIARVMVLFFGIVFIYSLKKTKFFNEPLSKNNSKQNYLILFVILVVFLCVVYYINNNSKNTEEKDYYSYNFVDAISEGNLYLSEIPNEDLINLENPYDYTERNENGLERDEDYIWDVALYNGKYYVYFGILPVIILLVPYHLITGNYLSINFAIYIFSIFLVFALEKLLENIFIQFFKNVPFKYFVLSLIILLSGSQILVLNGMPRYYELAIISGLFFAITGINFMFAFLKNNKARYCFLGSLFLSLAVACRPTMLFVSLIYIAVLINTIKKQNLFSDKKDLLKIILLTAIPYVVIGILLMIYNYIRFNNIFEFGTSYQLTLNDMSGLKNRFMTLGVGVMCNLFGLPTLSLSFPFISTNNYNSLVFYGYYYYETMLGGLFMLVPICFSILFIKKLYTSSEDREICKFIIIFMLIGILICIISVMMAGSVPRYIADYAWIFIIAGIMAFLELYNTYKTTEAKNILSKILYILAIYIVIINFCAGVVSEKSWFKENSPEAYYKLQYTINFWE